MPPLNSDTTKLLPSESKLQQAAVKIFSLSENHLRSCSVFVAHVCTNLFSELAGLLYRSSIKPAKLQEGTTTSQVGWPWSGPRTTKAASAPTRAASTSGMRCRTWSPPAPTPQLCLLTSQFSILLFYQKKLAWLTKETSPSPFCSSFQFINIFKCFSSIIVVKLLLMQVLFTIPLSCTSCITSGEHVYSSGRRPSLCLLSRPTERERTERLIKAKLRSIMMSKDLENVTSKEVNLQIPADSSC